MFLFRFIGQSIYSIIQLDSSSPCIHLQTLAMEKVHNYIVFMKTKEECRTILNMLIKTTSWNPHAKFFIYIDGQVEDKTDFVTFILTEFWKYFVLNITVSCPQKQVRYLKVNFNPLAQLNNLTGKTLFE